MPLENYSHEGFTKSIFSIKFIPSFFNRKLKGSYKKADDMMNANFPAGYKQ